jgi:hypothetical protein
MATTTSDGRIMIIARYNRKQWNSLKRDKNEDKDERHQAEEAAEGLFPEKEISVLLPLADEQHQFDIRYTHLRGIRQAQTFASEVFINLESRMEGGVFARLSRDQKDEILDEIYATKPNVEVGWITVIEEASFNAFIDKMNANGGILWRMYDIEVHPFSDEPAAMSFFPENESSQRSTAADTNTMYKYMTPTNWS